MRWAWLVLLCACGSIDLGDSSPVADPLIDEDFFYCRIMPEVIVAHGCSTGMGSSCHATTSALYLDPLAETEVPPTCDGNMLVGEPPESWERNFEAVRFTLRSDAYSSPFLLRPIGVMSHRPTVFPDGSPEANLIVEWLDRAR